MKKNGFTLLEVLIGMTIFAIIAASVYTSLYLGIKVFKNEETQETLLQETVISLHELAGIFRCAFISSGNENITFMGSGTRVEFFAINREGDLEKTSIYLQESPDLEKSLIISKEKVVKKEESEDIQVGVINSRINEFKLSYYDDKTSEWVDDWMESLVLPRQIRIQVAVGKLDNSSEGTELEKYVYLPVSDVVNFALEDQSSEK